MIKRMQMHRAFKIRWKKNILKITGWRHALRSEWPFVIILLVLIAGEL